MSDGRVCECRNVGGTEVTTAGREPSSSSSTTTVTITPDVGAGGATGVCPGASTSDVLLSRRRERLEDSIEAQRRVGPLVVDGRRPL